MLDREKVINDLQDAVNDDWMWQHADYYAKAMENAIVLLKEQETVMVIESENMYTGLPITHCPKCGKSLDRYLYGRRQEGEINFCPYCGQAVKWE